MRQEARSLNQGCTQPLTGSGQSENQGTSVVRANIFYHSCILGAESDEASPGDFEGGGSASSLFLEMLIVPGGPSDPTPTN